MKTNALRFLVATICLMTLTLTSKAQFWGSLPNAFYNLSLQDTVYQENFNGSIPRSLTNWRANLVGVFGGEEGSIFNYDGRIVTTIYNFEEGENDSLMLSVDYAVNEADDYIYGLNASQNFMLRLRSNGSGLQKTTLPDFDSDVPLFETSGGMYGVSYRAPGHPNGYIFKVKDDFSGIDIIYSFTGTTGGHPHSSLAQLIDGFYYGTASTGGTFGHGVLYKIALNGTGYSVVHNFDGTNGSYPLGDFGRNENSGLWGVTKSGGTHNGGTAFEIDGSGTGFRKIFDFNTASGTNPTGAVIKMDDDYLFGLTSSGGQHGFGTMFNIAIATGTNINFKDFDSRPLNLITVITAFGDDSFVTEPVNGQTGLGDTIQVHVQPAISATGYVVQLSKTPDFSGALLTTTIQGTSGEITGLEYGTTYYTRVRTNVTPFYLGPVTTFSTRGLENDTYVVSPEDGAVHVPTNVGVTALEVEGATIYTIELNTSPDFTGTSFVESSETNGLRTITFYDLSYFTKYYTRVKTDLSPNWGSTRSFTTIGPETIITSPINNSTVPGSHVDIHAEAVTGASTYTFKFYTLELETGVTAEFEFTINDNVFGPFALEPSTRYIVEAKTDINPNYGPSVVFFSSSVSGFAFVVSPANGQAGVSLNPVVTVNSISGAERYTVELNTASNFTGTSIVRTSTVDFQTSFNFTGLAPLTTYYTRVKSDLSPDWGPTKSFTTGAAVFITQPQNNQTEVSATPVFKISPVSGANRYFLEVSRSIDFSTIDFQRNESNPTIALTGLRYLTTYYARARTNLSAAFGPVIRFTTHAPERYSFVSSPVNGATNVGTTNVPITANIVYGATSYTIELDTDSNFSGASIVRSSAVPNQRTIIFPSLAPSTTYYSRTRTNLPSDWGPVRSFTTTSAGAPPPMEELSEVVEVMVYPNPFQRTFTAEIKNPTGDETTSFVLFDLTGREMYKIETMDPAVELGDDLPQGIYILRLTNNNRTFIKRVIKN